MNTVCKKNKLIPLSVPLIGENEYKYIKECLDTNWVSSSGTYVNKFEDYIASYTGAKGAVAVCNGTSALHTALKISGVSCNDEVIVSAMTFIASANVVSYVGAYPVFIDAEPEYFQMDIEKLKDFLEKDCSFTKQGLKNKHTNRYVKAIIPVHILGHPVDMQELMVLCERFKLIVIEDAAESLGTLCKYKGKWTHTGVIGNIGCFSFNGNKLITSGGGGMLVSNNDDMLVKANYLTRQAKNDSLEYIHNEVGYNYRLTNIQAALGLAQVERIESYVARKREIAKVYSNMLEDLPELILPQEATWAKSTFWLYTIRLDLDKCVCDARAFISKLGKYNIQSRPLWQPMHLSSAHKGAFAVDCSVAEKLFEDAVSLPSSLNMTKDEQEFVVKTIKDILL